MQSYKQYLITNDTMTFSFYQSKLTINDFMTMPDYMWFFIE